MRVGKVTLTTNTSLKLDMPKKAAARAKIIRSASDVFFKYGTRATGVDFIAKQAGVTKATLYHHFTNKDELIIETLKELSLFHRANYMRAWSKSGLTPEQQMTVLFDDMDAFFKQKDCYGCPFINVAGEYTERRHPVRQLCEAHYQFITDHLEKFARRAGMKTPRKLAQDITNIRHHQHYHGCLQRVVCMSS